jgi:hypothetical protein
MLFSDRLHRSQQGLGRSMPRRAASILTVRLLVEDHPTTAIRLLTSNLTDTEEQKAEFVRGPTALDQYCRDVEGELNKRFTLVSTHLWQVLCARLELTFFTDAPRQC